MIKVKAIRLGYYDHVRRREGDVFFVPEKLFSKTWMERLDGGAKAEAPVDEKKQEPKAKAVKKDEPVI